MNGRFADSDQYALAVVGTRSSSEYGRRCTELLCEEIVRLGITVVSGLARGIDTSAHSAVVRNGGRTIAVIGSGIDVIYPPENKALSERISECGAVVSECPMSAKPEAANFPRRNRLISGLSLGTIVVESDTGGGAMITAQLALDQDREVFAVPGPIFSKRSRGCNMLIREGKAKLVETLDEVVCELSNKLPMARPAGGRNRMLPQMSVFEQSIYDILSEEPDHIDALAERSRQSASDTLVNLLSLECKGLVKQLPGKMFIKI
jgi:DNA processing protein